MSLLVDARIVISAAMKANASLALFADMLFAAMQGLGDEATNGARAG